MSLGQNSVGTVNAKKCKINYGLLRLSPYLSSYFLWRGLGLIQLHIKSFIECVISSKTSPSSLLIFLLVLLRLVYPYSLYVFVSFFIKSVNVVGHWHWQHANNESLTTKILIDRLLGTFLVNLSQFKVSKIKITDKDKNIFYRKLVAQINIDKCHPLP